MNVAEFLASENIPLVYKVFNLEDCIYGVVSFVILNGPSLLIDYASKGL